MKIAMIGSGNVGKALATSSIRGGHSVTFSAAHPEKAQEAAQAVGAWAASSNRDAVRDADIVILALPAAVVDGVIDELGAALDGKIVVDVTNSMKPDGTGHPCEGGSVAERIEAKARSTRVVKAFNTAFVARQLDPKVDGVQLDGYVAGDDDAARTAVLELVRSIGFRPIDAGPLAMARALEALAFLNIRLQVRHKWPWQAGWKLVGPTGP